MKSQLQCKGTTITTPPNPQHTGAGYNHVSFSLGVSECNDMKFWIITVAAWVEDTKCRDKGCTRNHRVPFGRYRKQMRPRYPSHPLANTAACNILATLDKFCKSANFLLISVHYFNNRKPQWWWQLKLFRVGLNRFLFRRTFAFSNGVGTGAWGRVFAYDDCCGKQRNSLTALQLLCAKERALQIVGRRDFVEAARVP